MTSVVRPGYRWAYRSAKTGQFVTRAYGEKHAATCVRERVRMVLPT